MNRKANIAILAAMALPLIACSASNQTTAAPSTTAAATTTTMRRGEINDQDKVLISQLDDYWLKSAPRADLIQAAEKACAMMRAGMKLDMLATLSGGKVEGNSVTGDATKIGHAADFVHAAATAYCPDQLTGVN